MMAVTAGFKINYIHSEDLKSFCSVMLAAHAGIIAIEPDVHAVALPGMASGQVLSSRPAVANGHAPPAKKAAPSRTVSPSS